MQWLFQMEWKSTIKSVKKRDLAEYIAGKVVNPIKTIN